MDKAIREKAEKVTCLLIEREPVNPWLVEIDFDAADSPFRPVELHLGLPILIFEMKQYGVLITKDNVVQFVTDDIKNHQHEALDVYLTIVRYVVNPPPRRKSFGWFARMFTSPPKWTPPDAEWKWREVSDVGLANDEALVIKGVC